MTNNCGLQSISDVFVSRVRCSNIAATLGDASPAPFRRRRPKAYYLLRKTYLARKAACMVQAGRCRGVQKSFDFFYAVNYVPPGRLRKPALPIIYDPSHVRYPQLHPNERVHWLKANFKFITQAAYIQTISQFTKSEIVSIIGISPDRIFVTYPAPGEYFRPEKTADDGCLTKCRLVAGNYFLVVGTREPRKNFKTIAQAYVILPEALRRRFPLLWVGPSGCVRGDRRPLRPLRRNAGHRSLRNTMQEAIDAQAYRSSMEKRRPTLPDSPGMQAPGSRWICTADACQLLEIALHFSMAGHIQGLRLSAES